MKQRRIYTRPAASLPLLLSWVLVSGFFVLAFVVTVSSDQVVASMMAVGFLVSVAFGRIMWLASHIVVSPHGVTTKGLSRRGWLAWPDIDHFEREDLDAAVSPLSIVARTVDDATVTVCTIPFQPIFLDTWSDTTGRSIGSWAG